jgi:hypothetical protein
MKVFDTYLREWFLPHHESRESSTAILNNIAILFLTGAVESSLGSDGKPIFAVTKSSQIAWNAFTTRQDFEEWYRDGPRSKRFPVKLSLQKVPNSNTFQIDR